MSLKAAFVGLLQSSILKTTEIPESPTWQQDPSMFGSKLEFWARRAPAQRALQSFGSQSTPSLGVFGVLCPTPRAAVEGCVSEKKKNNKTKPQQSFMAHTKVAPTPQGIPQWAGTKSRDMWWAFSTPCYPSWPQSSPCPSLTPKSGPWRCPHLTFGPDRHHLSFICSLKKSHFITFQAPELCGVLQEVNEKFMLSVSNWHFCFFFLFSFFF